MWILGSQKKIMKNVRKRRPLLLRNIIIAHNLIRRHLELRRILLPMCFLPCFVLYRSVSDDDKKKCYLSIVCYSINIVAICSLVNLCRYKSFSFALRRIICIIIIIIISPRLEAGRNETRRRLVRIRHLKEAAYHYYY